MNKIYKFIIATLLIVNVSCNSDESSSNYGNGYNTGWIEVSGYGDDEVFEYTTNFDEGEIDIPILLNSGTNANGINVTYSIELIDGNVDNSVLGSKTVLIEKDSKESLIAFTPIYSDSYYTLKFKLENTDDSNFLIGLNDDSQPTEFILTVTNFKPFNANGTAFNDSYPDYVTSVGRIDNTHFSVKSLWGPNFVAWATNDASYEGQYLNEGILTLDISNNSITVKGDYTSETGSSGSYDSATGSFTFTFNQANLFGSEFAVNTILTPQP